MSTVYANNGGLVGSFRCEYEICTFYTPQFIENMGDETQIIVCCCPRH